MQERYKQYVNNLNNEDVNVRLDSLRKLKMGIEKGGLDAPVQGNDVNNHIHTTYSFSPYTPAKAIWMAYTSGLKTAGIMDHDSISGAREFIEAGRIIGMETTIGLECRADFSDTRLKGMRINNPDQKSVAYMAMHGIPHTQVDRATEFFKPYVIARNERNKKMTGKINSILSPFGISIDFEKDVMPLSMFHYGGSITERHILFALAKRLVDIYGKGQKLVDFLKYDLCMDIKERFQALLLDKGNEFYEYDLLGVLKSDMVAMFYIDAHKECPGVQDALKFCSSIGAISAYAYLGDVEDSVTGDKKAQKFEDDYLDIVFDVLGDLGFNAVTYMPSRNSLNQIKRLKSYCEDMGFLQISGEDINSPRQKFVCEAMRRKEFENLVESTWALIGHEKAATSNMEDAMFSKKTVGKYPDLDTRIKIYRKIGLCKE